MKIIIIILIFTQILSIVSIRRWRYAAQEYKKALDIVSKREMDLVNRIFDKIEKTEEV